MQFLTVSDEVVPSIYSLNIKERFGHIQAVLGCGDLPPYYLEFVVTMLAIPCFYIHGNHDGVEYTADGEMLNEPRGCVLLEGRSIFHEGLLIAGLGGSIREPVPCSRPSSNPAPAQRSSPVRPSLSPIVETWQLFDCAAGLGNALRRSGNRGVEGGKDLRRWRSITPAYGLLIAAKNVRSNDNRPSH